MIRPYRQFMSLQQLLIMVLTSHRIRESIELDDSAQYAVFSTRPAMFEYTIQVKNFGAPGLLKVQLEFGPDRALICDANTFNAVRDADRGRDNLTYLEISSGAELFAKPQKQEAFTPNGKPPPTLQEALSSIESMPASTGNFGRRQDGFTPNTKTAPSGIEKVGGLPANLLNTAAAKPSKNAKPPEGKEAFDFLNAGCYWKEGEEGFWRERGARDKSRDETLPFPVVQKCRGYNPGTFLIALENVQSKIKPKLFRGMSPNRWTGEFNGCAEYQVDGWKWPEGYRTYLAAGVLPSREFYNFITGKILKGLPSFAKD